MKSAIKLFSAAAMVALIVTLPAMSFSQTSRFGISLNSITTNFNYGKSNTALQPYKKNFTGLQAGFSYQAGITPGVSLVPELYFALKGGTLKEHNPLTMAKSKLRLYTLEMPVLARVHISRVYVNAGPYAAYTLGGRLKMEPSHGLPETSSRISFGNSPVDYKRWDAGVLAGAGYNFNIAKTGFTLDARYGWGLVNMSRDVERYSRMLNISLVVSKRPGKGSKNK